MNFIKSLSKKIGDPNTKSVVVNITLSFGVKGLSMFVALFTTPSYIRYFNNDEVLGVWFTILSILTWILSCDFGVGHGLRNKLAELFSKNDFKSAKSYISSVYAFLAIISFCFILVVSLFSKSINWNEIFNIEKTVVDSTTLSETVIILLTGICLQLFFNLITSILFAYQKAFIPSLLNLITSVAMLLITIASCKLGINGDIKTLAIFQTLSTNIPLLVATLILFGGKLKEVKPSLRYCEKRCATDMLKVGGVFLFLQFMSLILNTSDNYLITSFVGNSDVVEYQLYYKWFYLPSSLVVLVVTPIWSAVTKAQTENNYVWLNKLFKKVSLIGVLFVVAEFLLVLVIQILFDIWLGDESIKVDYFKAGIFALYGSFLIWSLVITYFVNGLGKLKVQTILLPIAIIIKLLFVFVAMKVEKNYIIVVMSNILAYLPYLVVQTVALKKYLKRKIIESET